MAENIEAPDGAVEPVVDNRGSDDVVPKSALEEAIAGRQKAKAKARDALAELAEYKAREAEAREAKLREQGEFEKLLEKERAEKEQIQAQMTSMVREHRTGMALDAVSTKVEGVDRSVLHAMMLLAEKQGVDIAPEEVSTDFVDTVVGHIKQMAPALFAAKPVGGTPGQPGSNDNPKDDKTRYRMLGKKLSTAARGNTGD